jgi:Fe2+ or Zn2+ uptake regulation protein
MSKESQIELPIHITKKNNNVTFCELKVDDTMSFNNQYPQYSLCKDHSLFCKKCLKIFDVNNKKKENEKHKRIIRKKNN